MCSGCNNAIVSAWVMTPPPLLANHNPAIFPVSSGTEKLNKFSRQTKSPDNSNMLHKFNNNTYIDFGADNKCILILSYVIQVIKKPSKFHKTKLYEL